MKYCLGEAAELYRGGTPRTAEKRYYENGTIAWLTPKDMSGWRGKYIRVGRRSITQAGLESCAARLLPAGTVLFSTRAPIGYTAIAAGPLCTNQGFAGIVCKEDVLHNEYLYYYLLQNRAKLEALGNGSVFPELSQRALADYLLELPPVNEQRNMVRELCALDEKYDQNRALLALLGQLLERLYCRYFEGEADGGEAVSVPRAVELISGGTPATGRREFWERGVYDWYRPVDITGGEGILIGSAEKKLSAEGVRHGGVRLVPEGAVLMTSRATIGAAAICTHEAATNQGILSLVAVDERLTPLQLYFWVRRNREKIERVANGSTFKEVYRKDFERLTICLRADDVFARESAALWRCYRELTRENELLQKLRAKLLEERFA